jgi:hypothetical protein
MSNNDCVADALRYIICNVQSGIKEKSKWEENQGSTEELAWSYKTPILTMSDDEDDDFGTFNPCRKIDLSGLLESLNNVTDEEVDKVRAQFGKNWVPCVGQKLDIDLKKSCSHNMIKKHLLTSFYFKCEKCGFEED